LKIPDASAIKGEIFTIIKQCGDFSPTTEKGSLNDINLEDLKTESIKRFSKELTDGLKNNSANIEIIIKKEDFENEDK
jgi:hypothetical protein